MQSSCMGVDLLADVKALFRNLRGCSTAIGLDFVMGGCV